MTDFSIIIALRKINEYATECVANILKQSHKYFEVIIITDEEEELSPSIEDSRIKIISSGPLGPGEKRNIGAKAAKGEILAFIDDDAYPEKDWLENASRIFNEIDIYALGGPGVTPPNVSFLEKMTGYLLESWMTGAGTIYRNKIAENREVEDYPTFNLFVKKSVFDSVGGFPINYWPGEDTKLCLDMIQNQQKKFLYSGSLVVYHHRRPLFSPFLKQISRYGRHRGLFAKIFPKTSRLPVFFIPSLFVLGLFFGLLVSLYVPSLFNLYAGALIVYLILILREGFLVFRTEKDTRTLLYVPIGIFLTHITYGTNFLIGLIIPPKMKLRKIDKETGNYLGG